MKWMVAGSVGMTLAGLRGGLVAAGVMSAAAAWSRRRRRLRQVPEVDVVEVATVLLVLVGAGLPLLPALAEAAVEAPEVDTVVRRARRVGAAAALASAQGPLAPLLSRLADAAISGASPEPAIRSFLEVERRRRHTAAIEKARRLPIRLMIPMTLLVLPGFVLMVYGPAFIGMILDLTGPLGT